jgi:hypothetical protein
MSDARMSGNEEGSTAKRSNLPEDERPAYAKRARGEKFLPDIGIANDSQLPDIKKVINDCSDDIANALKLDKNVSKQDNFTFTKDDKVNYLIVPKNLEALMKVQGWNSVLSFFITFGVRLKKSNIEIENPVVAPDLSGFMAGLANRVKYIQQNDDIQFKVTGTDAKSRGRAVVDILMLKQKSQQINLEKFLPSTATVNNRSPLKYYLSLICGAEGISSLKNVPDLINTVIKESLRNEHAKLDKAFSDFKIPLSSAIDDLLRKKQVERKEKGRKASISISVNYNRISNTPFCLVDEEVKYFKGLESPWDIIQEFTEKYASGIPLNELTNARALFSREYRAKAEFTQKFSSWKSRRLEAFRALGTFNLGKKEAENWRLSEKTKDSAFDNLPDLMREAASTRDKTNLKKILANLNPNKIPDYPLKANSPWRLLNADTVLQCVGLVPYYEPAELANLKVVFKMLGEFTAEITSISTTVPNPKKRKVKKKNKEDTSQDNAYAALEDKEEDMEEEDEKLS